MPNETVKIQKITAHIPERLLREAQNVTHAGITATIKVALEQLARANAYEALRDLKGGVKFTINLGDLRED